MGPASSVGVVGDPAAEAVSAQKVRPGRGAPAARPARPAPRAARSPRRRRRTGTPVRPPSPCRRPRRTRDAEHPGHRRGEPGERLPLADPLDRADPQAWLELRHYSTQQWIDIDSIEVPELWPRAVAKARPDGLLPGTTGPHDPRHSTPRGRVGERARRDRARRRVHRVHRLPPLLPPLLPAPARASTSPSGDRGPRCERR